jgi:hypothetical protein
MMSRHCLAGIRVLVIGIDPLGSRDRVRALIAEERPFQKDAS